MMRKQLEIEAEKFRSAHKVHKIFLVGEGEGLKLGFPETTIFC